MVASLGFPLVKDLTIMIDDVQYETGTHVRLPFLERQDQHGTLVALEPTDATPSFRRRLVKWAHLFPCGRVASLWVKANNDKQVAFRAGFFQSRTKP